MGRKNKKRWGWLTVFLFVFLTASYISRHWFQLIFIQGDSMQPAYHHLQLAVLDKRDQDYTYGDVIAFFCSGLDAVLVKRVVAVPGDTVQVMNETLYVNDRISRVYPKEGCFSYAGIAEKRIQLAQGEYFVVGDYIEKSRDSRYPEVGVVSIKTVIGKIGFNLKCK